MKIYNVIRSTGQYDDACSSVIASCSTHEKAQELIDKLSALDKLNEQNYIRCSECLDKLNEGADSSILSTHKCILCRNRHLELDDLGVSCDKSEPYPDECILYNIKETEFHLKDLL